MFLKWTSNSPDAAGWLPWTYRQFHVGLSLFAAMSQVAVNFRGSPSPLSASCSLWDDGDGVEVPVDARWRRQRGWIVSGLALERPQSIDSGQSGWWWGRAEVGRDRWCPDSAEQGPLLLIFSADSSDLQQKYNWHKSLLLLLNVLLISRSMDLWKTPRISSLYSIHKLSFPPFQIFSIFL